MTLTWIVQYLGKTSIDSLVLLLPHRFKYLEDEAVFLLEQFFIRRGVVQAPSFLPRLQRWLTPLCYFIFKLYPRHGLQRDPEACRMLEHLILSRAELSADDVAGGTFGMELVTLRRGDCLQAVPQQSDNIDSVADGFGVDDQDGVPTRSNVTDQNEDLAEDQLHPDFELS